MKRNSRVWGPLLGILLFVAAVAGVIALNWQSFPWFNPAGTIAAQERTIFFAVLGLSAIVVIPVFTLLIVIALRYREGNTKAKYMPEWSKNKVLELTWWGIPILIILIVGTISWISTHALDPYKGIASNVKPLNIQVVTLEWKWLFLYPDQGVATVNKLVLPNDTPVSFSLSADAPMSAFWIPSLGSQIYTMSGMNTQMHLMATKEGTYVGYNTNINGKGYAKMNFSVPVVSKSHFKSWVNKASHSSSMMDETAYRKLMKPSIPTHASEYMLMDPTLYDTIVMKYMAPMDGTNPDTTKSTDENTKKTEKPQNFMNMPGMEMSQ